MSVSDLVRKFKRAATDPEGPPVAKKSFDWEPERAMPSPHSSSSKAGEPAPAAPKPAAVPSLQQHPASEPSSVIGTGIPADVSDFAVVYKGAAVQPPSHGYGVDRIADMLAHGSLAGLDKSVKASAVLAALDAAGVSIDDVIHDGLLRYKALVAFEAAKELELQQVRPRNERRVDELRPKVAASRRTSRPRSTRSARGRRGREHADAPADAAAPKKSRFRPHGLAVRRALLGGCPDGLRPAEAPATPAPA
jgi:hypothetical protein